VSGKISETLALSDIDSDIGTEQNMDLLQIANRLAPPADLQFNVGGISFFIPSEIEEEQIGYAGQDWNVHWLVVARESACGDPVFVDTEQDGLPVFTAMHGMGYWKPEMIAKSWANFIEAVEFIRPFTSGREHPVGLEANPLSLSQRDAIRHGLEHVLGQPVPYFWEPYYEDDES
jgi:hypothetical protein